MSDLIVEARYNNKKVLVQSPTKELFDIPAINEEAVQLRKLIDQLNGHMSALETLVHLKRGKRYPLKMKYPKYKCYLNF
ncbi:unnamed protein product [Macrosiphum euphorbiae]|uniref:Uncharacterized protein n=1 Tax=Macrosiphum euphorbiae TaxID=13131 RepID=A0AAV0Y0Z5_9HEMI|nr:unnamed protein product [Macrosiphum euphorbiae]